MPTVLPGGKPSQPENDGKPKIRSFVLAGPAFRNTEAQLKAIELGNPVTLVREPGNQYDPLAVAVHIGGRHVGYVPKRPNTGLSSREASELLAAGWVAKGIVDRNEPGFPLSRWEIRIVAKFTPPGGTK